MNAGLGDADRAVLERWWQEFSARGALPEDLQLVQGRLIRAVHRGALPALGAVHVKTMAFPRAKDRLRYLLRPLPAAHEAAMLRAVAVAGLPCPEVVAVRTARRAGLPWRSMLVLRTMATGPEPGDDAARLRDEAALGVRLLEAGVVHPDLHGENFLRLHDGRLAVLDLQSARCRRGGATVARRVALAARLLQDRRGDLEALVGELVQAGLLGAEQRGEVVERVAAARRRFREGRLRRCFEDSTEFERRIRLSGVEHRLRGALPPGRWISGGRELREAWLDQRRRQLDGAEAPVFRAFFHKWWWLGGGAALYLPDTCPEESIQAVTRAAAIRPADAVDGQPPEGV
ncbi:MAG: hypothetical protein H6835_01580 [Planctomycetes bacterium]|nr:hypothetical protein [Planctomycetota bacterium]